MTRVEIAKAFEAIIGAPPRQADYAVIEMLGGEIDTVAEYLWDHWLGEPEHPTLEQVTEVVKKAIEPRPRSGAEISDTAKNPDPRD